eukprot:6186633-Pleurochrysis_carterae.AAC.1
MQCEWHVYARLSAYLMFVSFLCVLLRAVGQCKRQQEQVDHSIFRVDGKAEVCKGSALVNDDGWTHA